MPCRLIPVDDAASVLRIDLHVDGPVRRAAVADSRCLDPAENCVEFVLVDAEAVVLYGKGCRFFVEIECQASVDVHRTERSDARLCPWNVEKLSQLFC